MGHPGELHLPRGHAIPHRLLHGGCAAANPHPNPNQDAQSIQSTASLLYFVAALCGYGAAAFVPSLTLDRPLFYRELADGCYSPVVYYLAN